LHRSLRKADEAKNKMDLDQADLSAVNFTRELVKNARIAEWQNIEVLGIAIDADFGICNRNHRCQEI
jgi:hypothetical protein